MKKAKLLFIGTGFSALVFQILNKNKDIIFISSENILFKKKKYHFFNRRKSLENHRKLFTKYFASYGSIKINLGKNSILHDSLLDGGSTNMWGGVIKFNLFYKKLKKKYNQLQINPLSFENNGSISNLKNIYQIRDEKSTILNTKKFFLKKIIGYVLNFKKYQSGFKVKYINSKGKIEYIGCSKIIFGVSFIQFLDILVRSNYIKENYQISLDEYKMKYFLRFCKKFKFNNKFNFIIKYNLAGIINHFFGTQKKYFLNYCKKIPIFLEQVFFNKKNTLFLNLFLNQRKLIIQNSSESLSFGNSIHYCNLKIDNIPANIFLKKISKNLIGVSMPFVKQNRPGPISDDIVKFIIKLKNI